MSGGHNRCVPLPDAPEPPTCPTCGDVMFRGHYDEWTCAKCWRHIRAASEHAAFDIQRDYAPEADCQCVTCIPSRARREWALGEPDRSDDREQVIYEHELSKEQNQ